MILITLFNSNPKKNKGSGSYHWSHKPRIWLKTNEIFQEFSSGPQRNENTKRFPPKHGITTPTTDHPTNQPRLLLLAYFQLIIIRNMIEAGGYCKLEIIMTEAPFASRANALRLNKFGLTLGWIYNEFIGLTLTLRQPNVSFLVLRTFQL